VNVVPNELDFLLSFTFEIGLAADDYHCSSLPASYHHSRPFLMIEFIFGDSHRLLFASIKLHIIDSASLFSFRIQLFHYSLLK
jgi:hypothetical protein